ncbi:hypothetical protein Tco_0080477 [Tanacetum coccineum]
MPTSGQGLSAATIEQLITQRVAGTMAAYEANQNNQNRNGNPNVNVGGVVLVARKCTYQDFRKCQPLNFKGAEGVVGLTRCALTWWDSYKRTIGTDAAYSMTWKTLIKLMTEMVPEEEDRIQKFIGGLPDNIQGNLIDVKPTRLQDAIQIANHLIDQKLKGYTARNAENKRRVDKDPIDNRVQ